MKSLFRLALLLVSFILIRCNNDESVQPAIPGSVDTTATKHHQEIIPDKKDPATNTSSFPDSAFYQRGKFNNMPYRIMFPRKYDSTKTYPIVISLHGIGERGTDNEQQLTWGASLFQSDSISHKYPAFVVFPQCPVSNYWHDTAVLEKLKGMIDNLVSSYAIDPKRIYIQGLSMGAYGTYAMVARYSDLFAAAIAISGDGDKTKAHEMAKVYWRIYGGQKDTVVSGKKSEGMAEALRKAGASVSLKIYPGADHTDSWVDAFAEPDYCSWLFSKSKK